jgi:hypothetical protein
METKLEKQLGTPNQKSMYQRLGFMMEELQKQPFYKGKALELSKLANEMTKAYIAEMERVRLEKDMGRIIEMREVENMKMSIEQ